MPESTWSWLSIVTVVKDDSEGFSRTARSLHGQNLDGVEWIVIDSSVDPSKIPALAGLRRRRRSAPVRC